MTHKDLTVWQKSIQLVVEVYKLTKTLPEEEKYGLISQMRRAAVSIPSNIAEGSGRNSTKEYVRFVNISRASLSELDTQLIICKELSFVSDTKTIDGLINEIGKMLYRLNEKLVEKIDN